MDDPLQFNQIGNTCGEPQWIRCSDRMPPEETDVLVYARYGLDRKNKNTRNKDFFVAYWKLQYLTEIDWSIDCHCSCYEGDRETIVPIAWMPLPQPPKEEE